MGNPETTRRPARRSRTPRDLIHGAIDLAQHACRPTDHDLPRRGWPHAGQFEGLDEEESRRRCEEVFADSLEGHLLYTNKSLWFQPKFVQCTGSWSHENVTLLGDALHTVHPSLGSGTRFAMRDAVYLVDALAAADWEIPAALRGYEETRRHIAEGFQRAAVRSIGWYERLQTRPPRDLTTMTLEYVMRTGRVRYEDFRRNNPEMMRTYEELR